jgi:hypothetical protein
MRQRGDDESGLGAFGDAFLVDPASRDGGERKQAFPPRVTLGEPAGVDDAADALFDLAVAGVGLCGARATGAQSRVGEEQSRVLVQAHLICRSFNRTHAARTPGPAASSSLGVTSAA